MVEIKYNFIEISPIVFKLQEAEIGQMLVYINNTLVCRALVFLATGTQPCVLLCVLTCFILKFDNVIP